ncbi:MAG: 3'(2'),5'-bisphosphate nucleotidase [Candidatus Hydrogenedentes bacterium]|nr:3'(2'),5'-bisphosphate nucleotidase [Candidatus Hydrogenedentota bacterium]
MIDLKHPETALALDFVRKACTLSQRVQSKMAVENMTKSDFSPVTVADFAVQALATKALEDAFPEAVLIGEESGHDLEAPSGAEMLKLITDFVAGYTGPVSSAEVCRWLDKGGDANPTERYWTVDPIDGTRGYLRGGQYAIALALIEHGHVQMGLLGCPNLGDNCVPDMGLGAVLIARRGEGAWLSVAGEDFTPLQVSDCFNMKAARMMRSVEAGHTNVSEINQLAAALGLEAEPVIMDSQAKYGVLAAGGAELMFRLLSPGKEDYKECIWDQAAGTIILEEAGGRVTDLHGAELDFAQGRKLLKNTGIVASNGYLHEAALAAVAKTCNLG